MLTAAGCAGRIERVRAALDAAELDGLVLTDRRDLWWLCGLPLPAPFDAPAVAVLVTGGGLTVVAPAGTRPLVAANLHEYPPHVGGTQNPDQLRQAADLARQATAGRRLRRVGFFAEAQRQQLTARLGDSLQPEAWIGFDEPLAELQRPKDPDELACIRRSIAATQAAYAAVRATIAAGVSELEVLAAGQRAAMLSAGAPVFHFGDYQCASPGGTARDRRCAAGELYIVDAWSVVDGYWSDLCRTFPVGAIADLQASVLAHVADILREVPERLRPGLRGTELAAWMDARLREHPHLAEVGLVHHAGHGFGLRAHTAPDLNLPREGVLAVGDTVSVEPGAYTAELCAGVRLENSFRITETGCELLSDFPVTD